MRLAEEDSRTGHIMIMILIALDWTGPHTSIRPRLSLRSYEGYHEKYQIWPEEMTRGPTEQTACMACLI